MTLRSRILSGFGFVLVVFVALAVVVVVVQRNELVNQVDAELAAAAPLGRGPGGARPEPAGAERLPEPDVEVLAQPVSSFWVGAVLEDGTIRLLSTGQLLAATPDVSSVDPTSRTILATDLPSTDGTTTFRARLEPREPGDGVLVIATPRTDIDDAIDQLVLSFVIGGALLVTTLGLLAVWVTRLGLRPVSDVTATAQAIRSGEREQRAPEFDDRTEAGQLASAFNLMLDDRDEAEDRLRRFVSDASHELRTPLTSIRGYLDLWEEGAFRAEGATEDAVRRMQAESTRMAGLVDDLLQLARLDEGQPLEMTVVAVGTMLDDVVADAKAARPEARVTVGDVVPPELRAVLDQQRVQQVLAGLVNNALTHNDDPLVELRTRQRGGWVELTVTDDGVGMSADDAARAFDRFHRADGSRTRATGGSGLGLSIAKAVAERHGGSIELETAPGEGCTFTLRLPVAAG